MGLAELYHYCLEELADERTKNWFLVPSPVPITLIICSYLYFVLRCGPRFMKDRPPYSLKNFIRFYDVIQIVINAILVQEIFDAGWYEDFFIYCYKADYSYNPKPYKFAKIMWFVYMSKYFDFIETGIFVLRKKQRQISVLHLYHHVSTCVVTWLSTKYWGHGMAATVPCFNCSIHVLMYTFYFFASFGPKSQRYLQPIKPIITILQMVQFVVLIICACQAFYKPTCAEHIPSAIFIIVILAINFVLFYKFYNETYVSNKKKIN